MSEPLRPVAVIDGRSGRKLNNALTISFVENDSTPFAAAQQGAGDNVGLKLGILFGFRNGSPGNNVLTYADGSTLSIPTRAEKPTTVSRSGSTVATITRGATTTVTLPDGSMLMTFVPHPTEAKIPSMYRMLVQDARGAQLAILDVIRSSDGWTIGAEDVLDLVLGDFGGSANSSLPIPFIGTRIVLYREATPVERDVLLAACCEITLSARPYVAAMGATTSAASS